MRSVKPWILVLMFVLPARSQEVWKIEPMDLSDGPWFFFIASGATFEAPRPFHLFDPLKHREPVKLPLDASRDRILDRLEDGRVLISGRTSHDGFQVLDLRKGTTTPLAGDLADFKLRVGTTGFFVGRQESDFGAPLFALSLERPEARRLVLQARVLPDIHRSTSHLWVLTCESPSRLWRLDLDGKNPEPILQLPVEADPILSFRMDVSASGRFLAFSYGPKGDLFRGRILVIRDLEAKADLRMIQDLRLELSPCSSSTPHLEITWQDDRRLVFSETIVEDMSPNALVGGDFRYVEVDVFTGERLKMTPYRRGGLWHEKPPRPGEERRERKEVGGFVLEPGRLTFLGDEHPTVDLRDEQGLFHWDHLTCDPSGLYAMHYDRRAEPHALTFIDARSRESRVIHRGFAYQFFWR